MDTNPEANTPPSNTANDAPAIEALAAFLDEHDAHCPTCGYSLVGIHSTHCPECGWIITLRLDDGVDTRRIIQSTLWLVYMGLLISIPSLLSFALAWVSFGTIAILSAWYWIAIATGNLTLLLLCLYANLALRNSWKECETIVLLRRTRRLSSSILLITATTISIMWSVEIIGILV